MAVIGCIITKNYDVVLAKHHYVLGHSAQFVFHPTYRSPTDYGSVPRECNMLIWEMERYSSDISNPQFKSDFENYLNGQPSVFDSSDFAISPVGVNIWSQAGSIIMDCQMTYYPRNPRTLGIWRDWLQSLI